MTTSIIYDCDDVLLDWRAGFSNFLKEFDGIETRPGRPCAYDMKTWIGTDDRDFIVDRIKRFNSGYGGYYEHLSPMSGAVSAVHQLREAGYQDSILTSCGADKKTIRARIANLNRVFGEFKNVDFVELGESKKSHLAAHRISWFIEDGLDHARDGIETGHRVIVLEDNLNIDVTPDDKFVRLESWSDILETILEPETTPVVGF